MIKFYLLKIHFENIHRLQSCACVETLVNSMKIIFAKIAIKIVKDAQVKMFVYNVEKI